MVTAPAYAFERRTVCTTDKKNKKQHSTPVPFLNQRDREQKFNINRQKQKPQRPILELHGEGYTPNMEYDALSIRVPATAARSPH